VADERGAVKVANDVDTVAERQVRTAREGGEGPRADHENTVPGVAPLGGAGTSTGINIAPGSDDDGWIVPPPVQLADGTQVQLFKDGEALHAAFEAIGSARFRIGLEMYIFASDETGWAFAELLSKKAREGCRVYVVYDSFGSIGTESKLFEEMRKNGVKVREFHPVLPWRARFEWMPVTRNHRKLLVIDNDQAGLGGLNVAGEYAGSWVVRSQQAACGFWRDNAVGIRGPAATQFMRAFTHTWHYTKHRTKLGRLELLYNLDAVCGGGCEWPGLDGRYGYWHPRPRRNGDGRLWAVNNPAEPVRDREPGQLGILASVPRTRSPLRPFLNRLFSSAKKSISLTMAYFAPHDDLIDALCNAARRGVRVRLMLPAKCDVKALLVAARSFYETLLTAGVQVYERQDVILHAKTMVIDGLISMVGSSNLDYRSIDYNLELSTLIRSAEFGRQMEELFDNDVRFAKRIRAKDWRHRPTYDRAVQWLVSRARYLL
jgi:cardiolipin synthase A/B